MRILQVSPSYFPATRYGGPIYSVHGLCRALVEQGHEVHVFTTSVDGEGDSDVPLGEAVDLDGVQVWYFASRVLRRLYYSPSMLKELRKRISSFDIVHLHSVYLWPTWAGARVAQVAGVPYVLSPRGMLVQDLVLRKSRWLKTAWMRLIETGNIEKAAAIHVTSAKEAAALRQFGFRLPVVWNIPNGIVMPIPWSRQMLSDDVRKAIEQPGYALFFGRINWEKGLDRLLLAWKEVPGARLLIAGNDEEKYLPALRKVVREVGIADSVAFLPRRISGADKEALFAGARFFVLPSYSENFGNTVLEALIRGVPVVVTEEVGAGEVVQEVQGGLVVKGDPVALTRALKEIMESPEKWKLMAESAQKRIKEKYSWAAIAKQMSEAYEAIILHQGAGN